jgi:hypothetical protein
VPGKFIGTLIEIWLALDMLDLLQRWFNAWDHRWTQRDNGQSRNEHDGLSLIGHNNGFPAALLHQHHKPLTVESCDALQRQFSWSSGCYSVHPLIKND